MNRLTVGYYEGNGTGLFELGVGVGGGGTLNVVESVNVSCTGTFDQDGGSNVGTNACLKLFGTYDQSGGTNTFSNLEMHTATYNLSGGTCTFGNVRLGKSENSNSKFDMSGGSLTTTNNLYIGYEDDGSGELEISGGTVTAKRLHVGYALDDAGTATLDIQNDSAVIKVGEKLRFGKRSRLTITNGQDPTITMTESDASFEIDEDATAGNLDLGEMKLVFECEDNSDRKRLEVAGAEDEGLPDSEDFDSDNFLLKELVVGKDDATGPITLQMVDDEDNQDDDNNEALYVNTLTIKDGGTFAKVNGESWSVGQPDYDIYYKNGGAPKKFWMGDANLDGTVNDSDLNILLTNWGGTGKKWDQGDFNGDRAVNDSDLNILLANWGKRGGDFPADLDDDGDIDIDDVRLYLKKKG